MGSFTDSTMGSYEHNEIEIYGTDNANFWKGLGRSLTDCKKGDIIVVTKEFLVILKQGIPRELVQETMLVNVSSFFVVTVGR